MNDDYLLIFRLSLAVEIFGDGIMDIFKIFFFGLIFFFRLIFIL